jgi:uncharacterized membrane protein YgaE (UPF0421/DUF939 family)
MKRETLSAFQLSTRAAVAATVAVIIARLLGMQHPLYAMIAAVIVTDLVPKRTRALAIPRVAGTLIGAGLGAVIADFAPPSVWLFALGIMVAMLIAQLMRLHDAARLAGYLCGIVLLEHRDNAWLYALDRLLETLLGIGVAVLVSLLPKLIPEAKVTESGS